MEVAGSEPVRSLVDEVRYLVDTEGSLAVTDVVQAFADGRFQALDTPYIDFGFSRDVHWLVLPVANGTDADQQRILSFNMRFMQELSVYVRDGRGMRLLLDNGKASTFAERPVAHRHLAVPLTVPAGSELDLYIRYWSEGTTALPLSIESQTSYAELSGFHTAKNAAFYTFAGFMLLYAVLFAVAARSSVFASYGFYLMCVVLYVAHMDGYTFQYLWPDWPLWNASAALPLGLMLNVGGAVFSMAFLSTRQAYPVIHRLALGVIGISVCWALLGPWFAPSLSKQLAFPFTFVCAVLFLAFGITAYRSGHRGALFYVVGWSGLTGAALFTTLSHWSDGEMVVGSSFEIIRIGVLIDATGMALAALAQYRAIRRAALHEVREQARISEEATAMQHRLFDLEDRYQQAFQLATQRSHQLAEASHDLRQPLMAMRMALRSMSSGSQERQVMHDALQYLETLLDKYIRSVTADGGETPGSQEEVGEHIVERFPASVVLDSLAAMFGGVAAQQERTLTVVRSTCEIEANPIALLRVLNNLVDNAIKHADAGRILVGLRRAAQGPCFVVMDDGVGVQKGGAGDSAGFGLGLKIVDSLCRENGFTFETRHNRTRGLQARVQLRAPPATASAPR